MDEGRPAKERQASGSSNLLAGIADLQLELEALKSHQHMAKLLLSDLSAVEDEKRRSTFWLFIPIDAIHALSDDGRLSNHNLHPQNA